MDLEKLEIILEGQPKFRLKQAKAAIFKHLIDNWDQATDLPAALREILNKEYPLDIKAELKSEGKGEVVKVLLDLKDHRKIETVLMRHNDGRNTVCVSSQVGCPMGCSFCATGQLGFKRNLEHFEIVSQVLFFARYLKNLPEPETVSNLVFMGMGEPFLNYDNVLRAIRFLNSEDGMAIGARRISISTCGVVDGIKKIARENVQLNLAVSLNAPDDKLRDRLMPINKKYPIASVLKAIDQYIEKTSRQVMFEYVLLKGVNDSDDQARRLAKMMKKPLYVVNLINYNQTGKYMPSSELTVKRFKAILEDTGVKVTRRKSFGSEIDAACGQLAAKH